MMAGWDPTLYVNGPGHHSFVLLNGDINTSPPAGPRFPLMFHAVPKGTPYTWGNRFWYTGTFAWWGNITYSRANVPGAEHQHRLEPQVLRVGPVSSARTATYPGRPALRIR